MKHQNGLATALLTISLCALFCSVPGCGSAGASSAGGSAATIAGDPKPSALPPPSNGLVPLGFMAGQWVCVNPNKSINREHWMSPSGQTMLGMFQQMRADGFPTLYELTAIIDEKGEVLLYHRHLHRKLEIDDRRKDVDVFRLRSVADGRAEFVPAVDQPGGIESMVYRADGPASLVQDLFFKPDSKEKNFSSVYTRE